MSRPLNQESVNESEVIALIKAGLQRKFKLERIILFGSRARGNAQTDSDWDVLVIADTAIPFVERQTVARLALKPRSFPLDLLVYTPQEAQDASELTGSAIYWALREGKDFDAA